MSQLSTFAPQIVPPPGTVVVTLQGNSGGKVPPDITGNINVISATTEGTPRIVGNIGTNTLTLGFTDVDQNVIIGTTGFSTSHTVGVSVANTGLGFDVFNVLTTGADNVAIGQNTQRFSTSGSNNVSLGTSSLNITTGSNNIILGTAAGSSYVTSESSNIVIGNIGTVAESNTIRIGTQGAGAGQQNRAFIAGINGVTSSNAAFVTINTSTGQLGTTPVAFNFTYTNVTFAMSPYTVLATDEYISVDSSGGPVTLNFPNAATQGEAWIVKDRTASAAANNITLTTPGGVKTIDGGTTFVMNTNYQAVNIVGNGTNYEIY